MYINPNIAHQMFPITARIFCFHECSDMVKSKVACEFEENRLRNGEMVNFYSFSL